MKLTKDLQALLDGEIKRAVKDTLEAKGLAPEKPKNLSGANPFASRVSLTASCLSASNV